MKAGSWLTLGPPVMESMLGCVLSCFGAGASRGTRSSGNGVVLMPMPGCAAVVAAISRNTPNTPVVTVNLIPANERASGLPSEPPYILRCCRPLRPAIGWGETASLRRPRLVDSRPSQRVAHDNP